jgi:hypothetical protein
MLGRADLQCGREETKETLKGQRWSSGALEGLALPVACKTRLRLHRCQLRARLPAGAHIRLVLSHRLCGDCVEHDATELDNLNRTQGARLVAGRLEAG